MFFTGSGSRQNGKVRIVIVRPHLVATDLRRDTREIPLSSPNVSSSASESELEAADTFPPALEANTRFLQMSTTAAAATKVSKGTKVWEPIFFICLSLCQNSVARWQPKQTVSALCQLRPAT